MPCSLRLPSSMPDSRETLAEMLCPKDMSDILLTQSIHALLKRCLVLVKEKVRWWVASGFRWKECESEMLHTGTQHKHTHTHTHTHA